ncbi:MAG TPA: hypothetical protein VIF60_17260 [Burkholderiaceae bacterium]
MMNRKPLSGEDILLLNEQILSLDSRVANLAKRILRESVEHADCFVDSTAQEWARRIMVRVDHRQTH